ncbi:DNA internalization-related competence protein ComEC/Rec2 [Congregibacter variabilis]|uniref:DNA internalization-related competence protein ComEC/Rec2 n=1 Tax=Congregibacter variabilis TaxID=3081200 RepID=A0ABZ0I641_9GAMM|nr:DNA internalization-related competence protein ComEC/Rec2 [Congregibacter sp. IMCC43200]
MVAPYTLLILCLSAGITVLQLPVLPAPALVQLLILVTALAGLVSYSLRRFCWANVSLLLSQRLSLLMLSVCIASVFAILVLVPARSWQEKQLPMHCERQKLGLKGVVEGLVHRMGSHEDPRYRFTVRVLEVTPKSCAGPERVQVYLNAGKDAGFSAALGSNATPVTSAARAAPSEDYLLPGAKLIFDARLRRPWGLVNPGAENGERHFLVADIHAVGSAANLQIEPRFTWRDLGISEVRDRLRDTVSRNIQDRVPGEVGALLTALAVGDRRAMTPAVWERLRLYGVSHLLVISGMHISLLALPGWYFGVGLGRIIRLMFRIRANASVLPPVFAMLTAGGYGLLSGFALPSQRAVLMLAILMLPAMFGRTLPTGRVLPLAGVALFAFNPLGILSASFWLTLGAVALLLWCTVWRGPTSWLQAIGGAQGYMLLAMLPLGLFWFGEASGIGGLVNFIAIPLVTLAVVPLVLGSVLCLPIQEALADLALQAAAGLMSLLWSAMTHWESSISQWSTLHGSPGLLAFLLALMGVLILPLPASASKLVIATLLFAPLLVPAEGDNSDTAELIFFDVGQGTAVLVRQGDQALLYDTGGGAPGGPAIAARSVLPVFRMRGLQRLDTLIISHPDRDHSAGEGLVKQILGPYRIRRGVSESQSQACRLGETQRLGDAIVIRYLSQRLVGDSDNNASCAILLSVYGRKILLAGDIDSRRERALLAYWGRDLQVDILLAGHHGSASSNSRLWLRSLAPQIMVVTAGRSNRFGHPAARVLEAAAAQGISVINTALHGAVVFSIRADGLLSCEAVRNQWQPFWRRGAFPNDCIPPRSAIRGYNHRDR